MRRVMRAFLVAAYLSMAPSQHESMWAHLDGRPVAVLAVGEPVSPLVAPATQRA